jgi:6-phosphofructokinase 2
MASVATLTLNPAIDISSEAETVRPIQKTRISGERFEPGGGGINVARALAELGVSVEAIYLAGGGSGRALDHMLEQRGIRRTCIPIAGETRMSLQVFERSSGSEYRFVPEGPTVAESEWRACLEAAKECGCDYLVASGSLPGGVPDDFYARLGAVLARQGTRYVLDTSGEELRGALAEGGIFLVKPSHGELAELAGRRLDDIAEVREFALGMVERGEAENVAATMGDKGALLATRQGAYFLPALPVETRSAVGAGDSFLAAMTYGFAIGRNAKEAFRLGVAAGAATAEGAVADICRKADVERLLKLVPEI